MEDVPVALLHAAAVGIVFNPWLRLAFHSVLFFLISPPNDFFMFRTTFFWEVNYFTPI